MINEYDTLLGKKKGDETEIPVSEEISNKNRIISFKAKLAHIIRKVIGDNNQQVIDVKGKDEINEEVQQIESEKIEQENKNDNDKQKIRKELNEIMECLFGVNSLDDLNDEKDKDENEVLNSSEKEDSSEDGETEVCARCGALDLGGFCDCGTYDYLDAEDQMADMLLQEQVNQSLNDQTQAANNSEQFEVKLVNSQNQYQNERTGEDTSSLENHYQANDLSTQIDKQQESARKDEKPENINPNNNQQQQTNKPTQEESQTLLSSTEIVPNGRGKPFIDQEKLDNQQQKQNNISFIASPIHNRKFKNFKGQYESIELDSSPQSAQEQKQNRNSSASLTTSVSQSRTSSFISSSTSQNRRKYNKQKHASKQHKHESKTKSLKQEERQSQMRFSPKFLFQHQQYREPSPSPLQCALDFSSPMFCTHHEDAFNLIDLLSLPQRRKKSPDGLKYSAEKRRIMKEYAEIKKEKEEKKLEGENCTQIIQPDIKENIKLFKDEQNDQVDQNIQKDNNTSTTAVLEQQQKNKNKNDQSINSPKKNNSKRKNIIKEQNSTNQTQKLKEDTLNIVTTTVPNRVPTKQGEITSKAKISTSVPVQQTDNTSSLNLNQQPQSVESYFMKMSPEQKLQYNKPIEQYNKFIQECKRGRYEERFIIVNDKERQEDFKPSDPKENQIQQMKTDDDFIQNDHSPKMKRSISLSSLHNSQESTSSDSNIKETQTQTQQKVGSQEQKDYSKKYTDGQFNIQETKSSKRRKKIIEKKKKNIKEKNNSQQEKIPEITKQQGKSSSSIQTPKISQQKSQSFNSPLNQTKSDEIQNRISILEQSGSDEEIKQKAKSINEQHHRTKNEMNHHPENKQEQRFHNKQTESNHISSDTVPQIFLPKQSSFISSSINQSPQYTNTQQYDSQFSFHQIPPPPSVPNSEIVDVLQRLKYAILDSKSFFFPSDNLIDGDDDEIQSSSHQPNTYKPNPINANLIDKARIPVLKLTHNPTQLHADISYGVVSGVVNTDFVRGLLAVYRYARPIIMVVKQLLQYHHLNEPYKGGMSGYPLTLLVVSHLQQFRRNFGLEWKYASLGRLLTTFFQLYGESPDLPDPQTFALSSKSQLSQKESDRRAEFARIVPYSPSSPQLSQKESNLHKVSSNTNILRKSSSVEAFSPFVPQMQNIGMSFTGIETKQVGDKQFQPTQHLEKFSFQKFAISVRADGQYIPISQLLYTNRKLVLANDVSSNKSTMEGIGTGPNYMRRNSSNEIGMKYNAQMITDFMQNNAPQHAQLGSGAEFNAVHGVQNLFGMTNLMQMQQMNGVGQQIGVGIPMNMNMDNVGGMNEQQMQQIQQMQQLGNLQGMQFGYAQQSALNQMQLQNQFQIQQQQAYMPMNFPVNQSFPMMMSQQQKGNGIVAALTLAPTPTINIGAPSQIVVEDPLDYENNAARSCFAIKNIKTLFLQAYQSLTQDERENTQETSKDQSNTKDVQNNSDRNQLNNKENTTQRKNNHIFPPDLKIIEKFEQIISIRNRQQHQQIQKMHSLGNASNNIRSDQIEIQRLNQSTTLKQQEINEQNIEKKQQLKDIEIIPKEINNPNNSSMSIKISNSTQERDIPTSPLHLHRSPEFSLEKSNSSAFSSPNKLKENKDSIPQSISYSNTNVDHETIEKEPINNNLETTKQIKHSKQSDSIQDSSSNLSPVFPSGMNVHIPTKLGLLFSFDVEFTIERLRSNLFVNYNFGNPLAALFTPRRVFYDNLYDTFLPGEKHILHNKLKQIAKKKKEFFNNMDQQMLNSMIQEQKQESTTESPKSPISKDDQIIYNKDKQNHGQSESNTKQNKNLFNFSFSKSGNQQNFISDEQKAVSQTQDSQIENKNEDVSDDKKKRKRKKRKSKRSIQDQDYQISQIKQDSPIINSSPLVGVNSPSTKNKSKHNAQAQKGGQILKK